MGGVNTYNALIQSATLCHPSRGSYLFLHISRGSAAGAAPRPGYFMAPLTGALISAGIRPQGIPYKLPFIEFLEMPKLQKR